MIKSCIKEKKIFCKCWSKDFDSYIIIIYMWFIIKLFYLFLKMYKFLFWIYCVWFLFLVDCYYWLGNKNSIFVYICWFL